MNIDGIYQEASGEWIYDDLYLLSETDSRGIITYASDSFCRISGYTQEELIGQPHNIVRNPEMPREAFRQLWASVKEKGFWVGYVKNSRKGGGYYWVHATVLKSVDKNGNIHYVSIRTKPTREAISKAEALYATWR